MRLRELRFLSSVLRSLRSETRGSSVEECSARHASNEEVLIAQVTTSIHRRIAIFGSGVLLGLLLAGIAVVVRNSRSSEGAPVATLIGNGVHRHGEALEAINTMFPDVPAGCVDCPARLRMREASAEQSPDEGASVPPTTSACAFFVKG